MRIQFFVLMHDKYCVLINSLGQWRDTIPPVADKVVFRFYAADFIGETVLHCHFQRHEDLGL